MTLLSKHEEWDFAEYIYSYRGYTITKDCYAEDDCCHYIAVISVNGKQLVEFHGQDCLEQAKEYIDEVF